MSRWMIYGANGYTGRLIAHEAARRGQRPVIAGRNAEAINGLGSELGFEARVVDLLDREALQQSLRDVDVVLHCAGPFSATAQAMIDACLASSTHYLDITGEISVFEGAWKRSEEARQADIVLCPGAGFDVVPTDCLAARLVGEMPAATHLTLAFRADGGLSPGTAKTSVEGLARGGFVRRDGKLEAVPLAWKTRTIPFADGPLNAMTIPWGDVFTAWVSTGVGNIEVYLAVPPSTSRRLRRMRLIRPILALSPVQSLMKRRIEKSISGPDDDTRQSSGSLLWGEARSADGRVVTGHMRTPNGYDLTVTASLGLVEFLLNKRPPEGGYFTPSLLAGPAFAESLPGVTLDLSIA
ncbi:MAG: saccharopine dehydrogenase NADP-binding domain-containing protein [Gammaproteobacteria bacterium]|nr:saccharopine dehydrogenase NADP-binding domain-containing protein [Gammaproteobacteria bacterium]